jgi:hypothetical protein
LAPKVFEVAFGIPKYWPCASSAAQNHGSFGLFGVFSIPHSGAAYFSDYQGFSDFFSNTPPLPYSNTPFPNFGQNCLELFFPSRKPQVFEIVRNCSIVFENVAKRSPGRQALAALVSLPQHSNTPFPKSFDVPSPHC